jgi:hypothetical protein
MLSSWEILAGCSPFVEAGELFRLQWRRSIARIPMVVIENQVAIRSSVNVPEFIRPGKDPAHMLRIFAGLFGVCPPVAHERRPLVLLIECGKELVWLHNRRKIHVTMNHQQRGLVRHCT